MIYIDGILDAIGDLYMFILNEVIHRTDRFHDWTSVLSHLACCRSLHEETLKFRSFIICIYCLINI
jgi:hypothetical protein